MELLKDLVNIIPRRGIKEQLARDTILKYLDKEDITYKTQEFKTIIPITKKALLIADTKIIPCLGTSFVSGKITKDSKIMNSFAIDSDKSLILFNPISEGLCLPRYTEKFPSVAINKDSIVDLIMAQDITGEVVIEKEEFISTNILVGNTNNPETIIFAHYDSLVGPGALDNAAAVQTIFNVIKNNKNLLNNNLFVFAGSEEETISRPEAFYGFEMFDNTYKHIIDTSKKIIILDGIGIETPTITEKNIDWVFGITRIKEIKEKVIWMQNNQSIVMKYYHTELDTLDLIKPEYIKETEDLLISKLS